MESKDLRLYVDSEMVSPYAMSVFVALREKGLPFERIPVDLDGFANRHPDFLALSFSGRVPTLVHGDFSLSESSAITEYLEDVFPAVPVYPKDPRNRARARQIQGWLRSDLMPIRLERPTEVIFRGPRDIPLSSEAQSAAEKLFRAADALIPQNSANLFDQWCLADTDLALMLNRLVLNGDPVPQRLADYARQQWQRPTIQEWANPKR